MRFFPRSIAASTCILLSAFAILIQTSAPAAFASAYNAHPKLVVVIVIDQFRGDYLERYYDQFGEGGFRLLLDHGASFTDCNYDYATPRCSPALIATRTALLRTNGGIRRKRKWSPRWKMTTQNS